MGISIATLCPYRVANGEFGILVASDGLSDPFPKGKGPENRNGLGLEFYAISSETFKDVAQSWLYDIVAQRTQLAVAQGNLAENLEDGGPFIAEPYHIGIPDEFRSQFVNENRRTGVLVGLPEKSLPGFIDGPLSKNTIGGCQDINRCGNGFRIRPKR